MYHVMGLKICTRVPKITRKRSVSTIKYDNCVNDNFLPLQPSVGLVQIHLGTDELQQHVSESHYGNDSLVIDPIQIFELVLDQLIYTF